MYTCIYVLYIYIVTYVYKHGYFIYIIYTCKKIREHSFQPGISSDDIYIYISRPPILPRGMN